MKGTSITKESGWLRRGLFALSIACLLNIVGVCYSSLASETIDADRISSLKSGASSIWFDAQKDQWVFPEASKLNESDPSIENRHQHIATKALKSNSNSDWWLNLTDWIQNLFSGVAPLLIVSIILTLFVLIAYVAIKMGGGQVILGRSKTDLILESEREAAKIVDLPFEMPTSNKSLLERAEEYQRTGDYRTAVKFLFGHQLVELDANRCIRLQRGKTNRQYLKELKSAEELGNLFKQTMRVFEASFFGRKDVTKEVWVSLWKNLTEFDSLVRDANERRAKASELAATKGTLSELPSTEKTAKSFTTSATLVVCTLSFSSAILGCGKEEARLNNQYGQINQFHKNESLSNFTVLRSLCERRGIASAQITYLGAKANRLDAIVWAPPDYRVPNAEEIRWFHEWFSFSDSKKTLVFIGRDDSQSTAYWDRAAKDANDELRSKYLAEKSIVQSEFEVERQRNYRAQICDWFVQELEHVPTKKVDQWKGLWSEVVKADEADVRIRSVLIPLANAKEDNIDKIKNEIAARESAAAATATTPATAAPSASNASPPPAPTSVQAEMNSMDNDRDEDEEHYEIPLPESYDAEVLLSDEADQPIVTRLTCDDWGDSEILLVANGSFLLNGSLVSRGNQKLAGHLLGQLPDRARIGFLSQFGTTTIRDNASSEASGWELLRVWPLSLIVMHGLFLGAIALLALWPIFGRPGRLPTESLADFGKHVEALGELMQSTGDKKYALRMISDYFQDVRHDPRSYWVIETKPATEIQIKQVAFSPAPPTTNDAESNGIDNPFAQTK